MAQHIRQTFMKAFRTLKKEFGITHVGTKINCCRSCHFAEDRFKDGDTFLFSNYFQCSLKEYEARTEYYIYHSTKDTRKVCIRLQELMGDSWNVIVPKNRHTAIVVVRNM